MSDKPNAGGQAPTLTFPKIGGGTLGIGGEKSNWTLLVVYRGKHCPRCKNYLNTLQSMRASWEKAGFDIVVVSADSHDKVKADIEEFGWQFPVAYDLSEQQMRQLGLYISDPISPKETDRRFAEPSIYCIRPDGTFQVIAISNGPAARPDLPELLSGMIFTIENDRPPRGTV